MPTRSFNDLVIREAVESDAETGASSLLLCFRQSYSNFYTAETLASLSTSEAFTIAGYAQRLTDPSKITFVAVYKDKVVGFARATRAPDAEGYRKILSIYLEDEWKRLGVGRVLVSAILGGDKTKAYVETFRDNKPARNFYHSIGFTRTVKVMPAEDNEPSAIILARDRPKK